MRVSSSFPVCGKIRNTLPRTVPLIYNSRVQLRGIKVETGVGEATQRGENKGEEKRHEECWVLRGEACSSKLQQDPRNAIAELFSASFSLGARGVIYRPFRILDDRGNLRSAIGGPRDETICLTKGVQKCGTTREALEVRWRKRLACLR